MPRFKQRTLVLLGGFLTLLVLIMATSRAPAGESAVFVLDWIPYGSHTGFFTALQKGFFQEGGVDVTIQRGYGAGDTVKLLSSGKGDFGFADTGTLIVARSKGAKVKSVGVLYNKPPHTAYALKGSGIRAIKDLEGRSIGEAQGGAAIAIFPALAKINGIKAWTFVPMSPASKNPALLAKKVDVILTFADVGPALRSGAKKTGDEIVELRFADNGLDFYGNGVIVRDGDISKRGDQIRRFVNAAFKGVAYAIKNPDEGAGLFVRTNPNSDKALARAQWSVLTSLAWTDETKANGLGYMSREKMQKTIDLISKYRELKNKPVLGDVFAPQFLSKIVP